MTLPIIDFVVAYNQFKTPDWREMIKDTLTPLVKAVGAKYTLRVGPETDLLRNPEDRKDFPENAIFYVHGALNRKYANFDRVCEISALRPDLKFIVEFDSSAHRGNFDFEASYLRYRECPTLWDLDFIESPDAIIDKPVIIHTEGIDQLLEEPNSEEPTPFQQYLSMLLQVRRDD
ncbi:MAG: hypothetical protein WCV90_08005 [Candidatus Woesearchaeota archaeon]